MNAYRSTEAPKHDAQRLNPTLLFALSNLCAVTVISGGWWSRLYAFSNLCASAFSKYKSPAFSLEDQD